MDKKAVRHFQKVDPILASFIPKTGKIQFGKTGDYFLDLCESIISQQLAEKASTTIFKRFEKLFNGNVTPKKVLKIPDLKIREAGLSWSKVAFIKDLAEKVEKGDIDLATISSLSDDEIEEKLIRVKGIGKWTVEMFLMFSLGREDLFSHGDFGLRRAMKNLYGLSDKATKKEIEKITSKWSPYRTFACRILWKSLEIKQ